jgi:hypothetical protein
MVHFEGNCFGLEFFSGRVGAYVFSSNTGFKEFWRPDKLVKKRPRCGFNINRELMRLLRKEDFQQLQELQEEADEIKKWQDARRDELRMWQGAVCTQDA